MVVQLSLVLGRETVRSVQLGHLLERVEDGGCDALVRAVDDRPNLESVRPNQLALKAVDENLQECVQDISRDVDVISEGSKRRTGKCLTNGATPLRFLIVSFVLSIARMAEPCERSTRQSKRTSGVE